MKQLVGLLPDVFRGLTYYFDPAESLKPRFYRLYKVESAIYLFLFKIDIVFRHFQGEVIEAGTNDVTPGYRTKRLFIESEFIPLEAVMGELGRARALKVKQLISSTWMGSGRGLSSAWNLDRIMTSPSSSRRCSCRMARGPILFIRSSANTRPFVPKLSLRAPNVESAYCHFSIGPSHSSRRKWKKFQFLKE